MKKRYAFKFRPLIYVLAGIIVLLLTGVIVTNSLRLGGIEALGVPNVPLDITAIGVSALLIVVVAMYLFASSYTLKDDYLVYQLGFVRYKITYKNMIDIREEKTSHALVLNYMTIFKDKDGKENCIGKGLVLNINYNKKDEFIENIRDKNRLIRYELIDKNLEDDNIELN